MNLSPETRRTILVGEDDAEIRDYLKMMLSCRGFDIQPAADGNEVMGYFRSGPPPAAILLDIMMPNKDGFETLHEIRQLNADVPVIMLSGMASPMNVVQAIRSGATDFLAKPVDHEDLVRAIERALSSGEAGSEIQDAVSDGDMFFGGHPAMMELKACLPRVARSDVPVLIQGETGTGKEVLARRLHALSTRANRPFVKLNCAAVPSDLMESELFGYERGAFTGAFERKLGLFELADGGTILLDEIGDMDIRLQAKFLQVLQDHEFRRLGGKNSVRVHVRVVAATHQNLLEGIRNNRFREDLYYRLNVFTLTVPPLRERPDDILGIAEFLIQKHSSKQCPPLVMTPRLREALLAYPWPGNIRQLENIIRKLLVMREPEAIINELDGAIAPGKIQLASRTEPASPISLPRKKISADPASRLERALLAKEQAEVDAILEALQSTRWNRKRAAERLNIEYKALLYKMKKLAIEERSAKFSLPA